MRPRKITPEIDAICDAEAIRRLAHLPKRQRLTSKQIAEKNGLATLYIAQVISKKRRELEKKIDVSRGTAQTSINSLPNVNS